MVVVSIRVFLGDFFTTKPRLIKATQKEMYRLNYQYIKNDRITCLRCKKSMEEDEQEKWLKHEVINK